MLTRNCVQKLLKPTDKNARVTVFSNKPSPSNPLAYKNSWLGSIRSSLGRGIVNCDNAQYFDIESANDYSFGGFFTGEQLLAKIANTFYLPVSIRITLSGWPTRSWIILLDEDINSSEA